jgi:hypothetical protein
VSVTEPFGNSLLIFTRWMQNPFLELQNIWHISFDFYSHGNVEEGHRSFSDAGSCFGGSYVSESLIALCVAFFSVVTIIFFLLTLAGETVTTWKLTRNYGSARSAHAEELNRGRVVTMTRPEYGYPVYGSGDSYGGGSGTKYRKQRTTNMIVQY